MLLLLLNALLLNVLRPAERPAAEYAAAAAGHAPALEFAAPAAS